MPYPSPPRPHPPRRGAASVELAVLLPFLAFTFLVAVDWCRVYYVAHVLDDCARNGAHAAAGFAYQQRNLTAAQRESRGKAEAVKGATNLTPALTESNVTVATGSDAVTVTVTYTFQTITRFPLVGGPWTLTRTVRMRLNP